MRKNASGPGPRWRPTTTGLPSRLTAVWLAVVSVLTLGIVAVPTPAQAVPPDGWNNRHLDEITLLGSHNGFANDSDGVFGAGRNQSFSLHDQINQLNVRATELDIYGTANGVWTYHTTNWTGGGKRLRQHLYTIKDFLDRNRNEVFVLTLQDNTTPDQLRDEFASVPGLTDLALNPWEWNVRYQGWPKVSDMVDRNKRLLMLSGRNDKGHLNVHHMREWTMQNHYNDGIGVCTDRKGDGISTQLGAPGQGETFNGFSNTNARAFQKLFFANNFSARTYNDFHWSARACEGKTEGRMPNMISTDWIGHGGNRDAERFVNAANRSVSWTMGSLCIDVEGGRTGNGTPVQIWGCNWSNSQAWRRVPVDGVGFELRALGQCLDVAGGRAVRGNKIQIYGCNGTMSQRWAHEGSSGNRLRNLVTNMCIDLPNRNGTPGVDLQLWDCDGSVGQRFDWNLA
ncbi:MULTISPECIES: ricin-type beta-trefoil lectin domain protein [Streptomyces]|uniref:Ricin B lectin domain-containing protein n=1 Tax=Streptomyces tsukubensis (strain DSM 42081 / NBRC 108919 / NRRL 18488 / 9993) TaxID=1114943 RepID=I2N2U7_STRT9|nr:MULTISPECIES: ricin-type beta-trefoil lectin domain protein [Streptomyces]AZK95460.1 hypothetical protein B7R87_17530 [Streptomyces tsukubensis]EIF91344.1 hypothetical protein [Streptomyces tsukubensis NRRL18488]MYS66645.1 hypothetical protein [Streptomyces sp. SID5473]QKM68497.1 hypothetical protein STSU_016265 [Streptomyces tsukubensis NRRL18488]TAI43308.1 hypothetical protein EWI31_16030 [Streptomyces tsukubensis]